MSTGTIQSNSFCATVQDAGYLYGYSYITCYAANTAGVGLSTFAPTMDESSCFAGSETVTLANGDTKSIADVVVGDSVLAFSPDTKDAFIFSDVIATPHARNSIAASFQHIVTESGSDVKMTAEHLLPAGACSAEGLPLIRAEEVRVGDCVQTVNGNEVVASNYVVQSEGIYTVVVQDAEFVVVNKFVASPFAVNHAVGNSVYNLHRLVYAWAPEVVKSAAFSAVNAIAANLAAYFSK